MPSVTELLATLERDHFLNAFEQLDAGPTTRFAGAIKFDVVFDDKRYVPEQVIGLALENAYRRVSGLRDFVVRGKISAFRSALHRCGFTIVPKVGSEPAVALKKTVGEILLLQTRYSSQSTDAMVRRGYLVRNELADLLYAQVERYEPRFTAHGYAFEVEGRDGIGRKVMSPWTRIYDPVMSPSATQGWYVVIHFSSRGDFFYLTLGCGATIFKDGSLADVDPKELSDKIRWAQRCFEEQPQSTANFADAVVLHGNHLSSQFEKSIAFAKRYSLQDFDENGFWEDLTILTGMLIAIYEAERLGKAPLSEAPEVREYQAQLPQVVKTKSKTGNGQGRFLSQAEKVAVELHAMATAQHALVEHGFTDIEDMSSTAPYDFSAKKDGGDWFIEVKGTTSAHADSFLLTANELSLHQGNKGQTVLAIVYDIDLKRQGETPSASGGSLSINIPWDPDQWLFKPTAYSASRKT
ncbi:DUF3578 domain-containing protein [Pseudomonas mandelii]|uniref:MrcB family domain-containing protein n=1 Tax=Pseudomonas mandelii TaxID=75612 RepID=UPI0012B3CED6|nr:DUF3578 domain-containing protein [Pseudomonas mandelii]MSU93949.1 DUF3578 domain-containing protein [Pseudomonas mandelii]